ncbi:MAG: YajQ family cyclic di-GMP-binding protein [Armatimonadetes bacterium]|nr:YajQ family cyclic di-GMP-binding protein [Armatimonadota bacterium]MDE2206957.1 YajQ family cyclic di-GMP-binding protein [Armatimonadota bacterium]
MAADFSFDVVSRVDLAEVKNAIQQAQRELEGRFDFRNTKSSVTLEEATLKLVGDDEFRLQTLLDIVRARLAKRDVSLKSLEYGKLEQGSGGTVRQTVTLKQGLEKDAARDMIKRIKAMNLKVNAQMQGDELRVSGKVKDDLQKVQAMLKAIEELPFDIQFVNYR